MKTNPRTPQPIITGLTPAQSASGPTITNESGTSAVAASQSTLRTRPRISAGTARWTSVFQVTVPAVQPQLAMNATTIACHGALVSA